MPRRRPPRRTIAEDRKYKAQNYSRHIYGYPTTAEATRDRNGNECVFIPINGHEWNDNYWNMNNYMKCVNGIIVSNQNDFTSYNWPFGTDRAFLNVDERERTILPKQQGSYSGILIDPNQLYSTGIPKIIGYIICTEEVNSLNGVEYIYMDYVELHSGLGQGRGLCTSMIHEMLRHLIQVENYHSFKIYNASHNGMAARSCYIKGAHYNYLTIYYIGGRGDYEDLNYREHELRVNNREGNFSIEYKNSWAQIPNLEGLGDETYFMIDWNYYNNESEDESEDEDGDGDGDENEVDANQYDFQGDGNQYDFQGDGNQYHDRWDEYDYDGDAIMY